MKEEIINDFLEKYDAWFASNGIDFFQREKKNEKMLNRFLKDYSRDNVSKMDIDDYVVGKGLDSFCKLVEIDLKDYGSITARKLNAWAKFGIFYNDEKKDYQFGARFGRDEKTVFNNIRAAVLEIIDAAQNNDYDTLASSKLNPLFKNKIFYLYNSSESLPIYSEKDLNILLTAFSIPFNKKKDRAYKRKLLFDFYKSLNREDITPIRCMRFVYNPMGYRRLLRAHEFNALLKDDLKGKEYSLIDVKHLKDLSLPHSNEEKEGLVSDKPDSMIQKKITGKKGEEIVKEYLLTHKDELKIVGEIDCACEYSDYKHYDFSYLNTEGQRIFIEVKATRGNNADKINFEMSDKEYDFMFDNIDSYYFYYINDVFNGNIIKRICAKQIIAKPSKYKILMVIND